MIGNTLLLLAEHSTSYDSFHTRMCLRYKYRASTTTSQTKFIADDKERRRSTQYSTLSPFHARKNINLRHGVRPSGSQL